MVVRALAALAVCSYGASLPNFTGYFGIYSPLEVFAVFLRVVSPIMLVLLQIAVQMRDRFKAFGVEAGSSGFRLLLTDAQSFIRRGTA